MLARRADATVVRVGGAVAKAHPPGTDTGALRVRLGVAAHPLSRGVLLPPYGVEPAVLEGRAVSVWPYGVPVDPGEPEAAPWEEAATLLARLHAIPPDDLPGPLPPMRGPAKVAGAMARLRGAPDSAAARTVRRAWRRLPAWARDEAPYEGRSALCHGDWHLGQLVHAQAEGRVPPPPAGDGPLPGPRAYPPAPAGWRLIDVDDLGVGDPAWDLARPAMWFGAGLLAPGTWARFLDAYRAAGGRAVAAAGDPWRDLDVPARALAVQSAATAVAKAARDGREPDEAESQLIGACARIAQLQ
ncbi:MAG TPA: phosphotransferase [Streptomyces sp.]